MKHKMNTEKLIIHNRHILKKFTRDKGYVNIQVEQIDESGKVVNVFKNRYCASRYIIENKMSDFVSPRGLGYTRASVAGNLTNCMVRYTGYAYGYFWRLVSPHSAPVKVTKKYKPDNAGFRPRSADYKDYPRWLVLTGNKVIPYQSKRDIQMVYAWPMNKIEQMIKSQAVVNGVSIIPATSFPKEKQFNSYAEIQRFLRVSRDTAKDIVKNKTVNKGYICAIDPATIARNMAMTQPLRRANGY